MYQWKTSSSAVVGITIERIINHFGIGGAGGLAGEFRCESRDFGRDGDDRADGWFKPDGKLSTHCIRE